MTELFSRVCIILNSLHIFSREVSRAVPGLDSAGITVVESDVTMAEFVRWTILELYTPFPAWRNQWLIHSTRISLVPAPDVLEKCCVRALSILMSIPRVLIPLRRSSIAYSPLNLSVGMEGVRAFLTLKCYYISGVPGLIRQVSRAVPGLDSAEITAVESDVTIAEFVRWIILELYTPFPAWRYQLSVADSLDQYFARSSSRRAGKTFRTCSVDSDEHSEGFNTPLA